MGAATLRHFRPGQFLFREGDQPSSVFILNKGTVSIQKRKGGGFIELGKAHSKEVVGEISFFDRQSRSASAVALSEVEALEVSYDALSQVYKNVPDYMQAIIAAMADRLRKADDQIRRLQSQAFENPSEMLESAPIEDETAPEAILATALKVKDSDPKKK